MLAGPLVRLLRGEAAEAGLELVVAVLGARGAGARAFALPAARELQSRQLALKLFQRGGLVSLHCGDPQSEFLEKSSLLIHLM